MNGQQNAKGSGREASSTKPDIATSKLKLNTINFCLFNCVIWSHCFKLNELQKI